MIFSRHTRIVFRTPRKLTPRPIPDSELNGVITDDELTALQKRTAERAERAKLDLGSLWCCAPSNRVGRWL